MSEAGTSGGRSGTSGTRRRWALIGLVWFLCVVLLRGYAEGASRLADLARAGVTVAPWKIWLGEASSIAVLLALGVVLWRLVGWARPPRFGWPALAALYLCASVVFTLLHVGGMTLLRMAGYWLADERYRFSDPVGQTLYEYRKDVATFVQFVALAIAARWWLAREDAPIARTIAATTARMLDVSDGAITHHLPIAEIDQAVAAGNYVELHWRGRRLLHRATLGAVEANLGEAFVRIHRSRLVRRDAIRRVTVDRSGDFAVELDGGAVARGSRRYRAALDAAAG